MFGNHTPFTGWCRPRECCDKMMLKYLYLKRKKQVILLDMCSANCFSDLPMVSFKLFPSQLEITH